MAQGGEKTQIFKVNTAIDSFSLKILLLVSYLAQRNRSIIILGFIKFSFDCRNPRASFPSYKVNGFKPPTRLKSVHFGAADSAFLALSAP